jgi:hypothetical protein
MQSAWERSGKFEGDIMFSEKQANVFIHSGRRWPGKTVPFYIDPVFSKYCITKLQNGMRGVEGNMHYDYRFISSTHWRLSRRVIEIISYAYFKRIIHPQTSVKSAM